MYRARVVVVTGTVQKQAWEDKVLPPVEQVRPGLWSIPVPIPDNPLRYVLVYALELDGGGVAIVDAGWDTDEAWGALTSGLATAGGSVSDVRAVLVTHIHPDHYGLAGRVREASGAWIGLHPDDAVMLDSRYGDTDALLDAMFHFLADSGVPEGKLPDLAFASMVMKSMVTMAAPDVLFEDGQVVDLPGWPLRTIWTPGHSPGHVCFHSVEERLLLSGDHILPRITPNISVHAQQVPNPLGDYLIVRQSDAHAWVEAWLPERGWIRLDPTALTVPALLTGGVQAAAPLPTPAWIPGFLRTSLPVWHRIQLLRDLAAMHWERNVARLGAREQYRGILFGLARCA